MRTSERAHARARLAAYDPEGALALAVVALAQREAAVGNAAAIAWLEGVRADLIVAAPPALAQRWAEAAPPGQLLAEAYRARRRQGMSFRAAFAELGGSARSAAAWWNDGG